MKRKLNKKDYRLIGICVLIAAISCFIAVKYFYKAFPEASIDFKITKQESHSLADKFLKKLGMEPGGFQHAGIFAYDNQTKVFLERELGLDEANKIMGSQIRLWRWQNRYFKPLQKEEFTVDVSSKGEILGFEHLIEEAKEGAYLSEEEARKMAENYLVEVMERDTSDLEFLSAKLEERPNRLDYTFTYKTFEIKDAEYRIELTIQGDEVGGYKEFLKIPEKWTRSYKKLRSLNSAAGQTSSLFFYLIGLAMLVVLITRTRHKDIKWKTAIIFGTVAFVLVFLASLNAFPLTLFWYETTESYGSFIGNQMLSNVLNALLMGALIFLITACAEPLYRENYKDKISLTNLFKWHSIRTKRFFTAIIVGLTMGFFFIAYQVIFYIGVGKLGAWSPADVPYSEMLNTKIPWIFALLIGFQPAVTEEFMFRMFSIPFFKKLLKLKWLAIIVPAFIWGFLHSSYPQQPFYIRGIEVGVAGIIVGILMLKFGILATLVWHYTIDAFYTAFLMLRSTNPYFVVSGALTAGIMFIPLIICIFFYLKNKGFESEEELVNEKEEISRIEIEVEERTEIREISYIPLSPRRIGIGIIIAGILLCFFFLKAERFGDFINYRIPKKEVQEIADEFLKSKNVEPYDYKSVTFTHSEFNRYAAKYILNRQGVSGVNKVYGEDIVSALWCTRYFKPLEEEEYKVYVNPKNEKTYTFEHIIAEDEEGADLSKDEALNIGLNFLQPQGIDTAKYALKEVTPEKKPSRRDYTIIWEAKEGIDEAKLRLKLGIQGDKVSKFERFMKIPEEWERERKKNTGFDTSRMGLSILFGVALGVLSLWLLIVKARQGEIKWKPIIIISFFFVTLQLLSRLNDLPLLYKRYSTSIALNIFTTTSVIGIFMSLIGIFILASICVGLVTTLYPDALWTSHAKNRAKLARDAVICSLITLGCLIGINRLGDVLVYRFPKFSVIPSFPLPKYIDTVIPFISYLNSIAIQTILILTGLGAGIYLIRQHIKKPIYAIILAILAIAAYTQGKTSAEFILSFVLLGLKAGVIFILVKWFLRENLLAYPLSCFLVLGLNRFYTLYTQSAFRIDAIVLLVISVIPIIWLVLSTPKKVFFSSKG